MQPEFRYVHLDDLDKLISVENPDKDTDPNLFQIVSSLMIHGSCDLQNRKSPYMQNGKCMKYFPKKFVNVTTIDSNGYLIYKKGESFADNRLVVPYYR